MKTPISKFKVEHLMVYLTNTARKNYEKHRKRDLEDAVAEARIGPVPAYVRGEGMRTFLAVIVDDRGCFMVKPRGATSGTAITFIQAPRDPKLKPGLYSE